VSVRAPAPRCAVHRRYLGLILGVRRRLERLKVGRGVDGKRDRCIGRGHFNGLHYRDRAERGVLKSVSDAVRPDLAFFWRCAYHERCRSHPIPGLPTADRADSTPGRAWRSQKATCWVRQHLELSSGQGHRPAALCTCQVAGMGLYTSAAPAIKSTASTASARHARARAMASGSGSGWLNQPRAERNVGLTVDGNRLYLAASCSTSRSASLPHQARSRLDVVRVTSSSTR